ncbi:MAG: hypothetical protein GSR80_001081 [Desulfurococcales archaeon]|nr:hypothetical protein [Desulfurococcales archaeon]
MPPVFLYSKVVLHWGFIVRQLGASAAQLAYALPPPPTVVGAFANPLARILGLGEEVDRRLAPAGSRVMACALKATLAAAAGLGGPVGSAVHAEPSRIAAALYKTGGDYSRALREPAYLAADRLLPVQAEGAASAPGAILHLAWLVDLEGLSACLSEAYGRGVSVSSREALAAAWSVYRLGSREGLASTVVARLYGAGELEELGEGSAFESILYQHADCVEPGEPVASVTLYDSSYREAVYYVPSGPSGPSVVSPPARPALFEARSGCRVVRPHGRGELAIAYRARG